VHSTRQDPNLAALQAGAGLPGHVLDVVVLTADPGVLATLREAAGPEHAIWHAPSADTAVDLLVGGRCSILIADLGALRGDAGDAAALLDQLHAQFPELILMATGRRDEEHSVALLVSDGRIYRFLHKPVSPARANLFLQAATRRYNELRNAVPVNLTTGKHVAPRSNATAIVVGLVVLLAAAVGAAFWWNGRKEPAQVAPPPRAVGTLTQEEQIADFLARGEMAFATDRLLNPRGNNAVEYFRAVLALQPDNVGAQTGLERVGMKLEARVMEALQARDPARGATALATLQHAVPEYPRLDALRAELLTLSRSSRTPLSVAPAPAPPPVKKPAARTTAPAAAPTPTPTPPPAATSAVEAPTETAPAPHANASELEKQQLALAEAQQRALAASVVQAKTLKRVREVPPAYPREAERLGLSGWVDVEFTIATNGTTQDLVVRNAEPLRTFDQAAIDAVKRWRFEPVMRGGAAVEQRAAVRIRFELK
jgi:TonB family protein